MIVSHQVFVEAVEDVGVEMSLAEILEHAYGVETRLGAVDRYEAVSAIDRLHTARLGHAVAVADASFFSLLLLHQSFARSFAGVAVRARVFRVGVGDELPARFRVEFVTKLACHSTIKLMFLILLHRVSVLLRKHVFGGLCCCVSILFITRK